MARHPLPVRRLVLPPIRTVTVGIGVSPIQPQGRTSRVADCHRRFGFSPTPEHVCLATSMPLRGMDVHHGRRTWLSPRGDSTWRSRWGTRSGHTHHGSSGTEQQIYHGLHSDGLLSPRTWHWMRGQELEEGSGKDRGLTGRIRDRQDQRRGGRSTWMVGSSSSPPAVSSDTSVPSGLTGASVAPGRGTECELVAVAWLAPVVWAGAFSPAHSEPSLAW